MNYLLMYGLNDIQGSTHYFPSAKYFLKDLQDREKMRHL